MWRAVPLSATVSCMDPRFISYAWDMRDWVLGSGVRVKVGDRGRWRSIRDVQQVSPVPYAVTIWVIRE